jgi:hypothetical protein
MEALARSAKVRLAAVITTGMLAVGLAAAPAASAQQQGLVNVNVSKVLNHNNVAVTVPITAAANVCGVSVDVLTSQLANAPVSCTSRGGQQVTVSLPQ